ncbi:MAG: hypothetical protein HIU81_12420 [Acidobacteria bacterium]|nr:hypothetical protein [Acidobacteriota bacterium]
MQEQSSTRNTGVAAGPSVLSKAAAYFTIDFPKGQRQPALGRFIVAAIVSVVVSLAACAVIVVIGTAIFPATKGYEHFGFLNYAKLTVPGVLAACLAWPAVTLISSRAVRLFVWLTVAVTVVGLVPDAWILFRGAPAAAVLVLVVMHIALALVTFPALVLIAPQPRTAVAGRHG